MACCPEPTAISTRSIGSLELRKNPAPYPRTLHGKCEKLSVDVIHLPFSAARFMHKHSNTGLTQTSVNVLRRGPSISLSTGQVLQDRTTTKSPVTGIHVLATPAKSGLPLPPNRLAPASPRLICG